MSVKFSPESQARFQKVLECYPNKQAALLPTLWIAQEEFGWIRSDVMEYIAELLELPVSHVRSVASFYTLANKKPVGRYHIQVCWNISCSLRGADHILDYLKQKLGIDVGETTRDGRFTLTAVECLAACGAAPVMQINDDYYENLTYERIDQILEQLT